MNQLENTIEQMLISYLPALSNDKLVEAIDVLKSIVHQKNIVENCIIQQIDKDTNHIYFICSGFVRCFYFDTIGNEITHIFMKRNDFCYGELLIQNIPVYLNYETISNCDFLCIPVNSLSNLIYTSDILKNLYISVLEKSLRYKMQREYSLLVQNATARYIDFIETYQEIEKFIRQSHIASYLGITPVSLSRIRRALRKELDSCVK